MIDAFAGVVNSPLYGITLTLAVYWVAVRLWERTGRHVLLNPVLVAMMLGAVAVWALGTTYEQYLAGGRFIGFLLGPSTVALALPIYRQRDTIRKAAPMVVTSLVVGCVAAIAAGYWATRLLGGSREMSLTMAPKSATTPISIALAQQIGGIPALAAIFTIVAGVIGGVIGPALLTAVRIRDERARGLAIGVSSHGVGTARALAEDETTGAFSGLAMALNGLATSLLVGGVLALMGV